jgi:flagellar biosynthetic protein FliP
VKRGTALLAAAVALLAPAVSLAADPVAAPAAPAAGAAASSSAVQLVVILALASLAPAIVLSCTTFVRFVIVFGFLKTSLGTQGAPPSQTLVGLALFMTVFVMAPTAERVHAEAVRPYLDGQMNERQALDAATPAMQAFLLPRTRQADLALFYELTDAPRPQAAADVSLRIAVPAFVLSELRTSFQMGLVLLLPFLVIDLVIAVVLSSLGMVMLPPALVSLPVKLLVFLAVDGWHLLVRSLLRGVMA